MRLGSGIVSNRTAEPFQHRGSSLGSCKETRVFVIAFPERNLAHFLGKVNPRRKKKSCRMRRTLRICRNAWMRYGNYPGRPSPVLPQSDDSGKEQDCRFSTLQGSAGSVFSCAAGTTASVKQTRSQPRQRGCSKGLGCYPNKQKLRFPVTPGTAVSSLYGNKDTACQVAT